MKQRLAMDGPRTQPTSRRRFILLAPLASPWVLAACSKKEDTGAMPSAQTAPAPAPYTAPPPVASGSPGTDAPPSTATGSAPAAGSTTATATGPIVDEQESIAQSLGYVADARRTDKVRFPAYRDGMVCSNCSLYAGQSADATGPCTLFANRQVAAKGWCSAYVKKAA